MSTIPKTPKERDAKMKDTTSIELFGKKVEVKGYCCTEKPKEGFPPVSPRLTLFIKLTNDCNGGCLHCTNQRHKTCLGAPAINYSRLESTLSFLVQHDYLQRIALTGGESMLYPEAVDKVLGIIAERAPGKYVSINTNGTNLMEFLSMKNREVLTNIILSRNHYDDVRNSAICGTYTPSKREIQDFVEKLWAPDILQFNCLFIKGQIDSESELERYLDFADDCYINVCGFASLHPVNRYALEHYVDPVPLFEALPAKKFITTNHNYDKDICECMNAIYIGPSGSPIKLYWRGLKQLGYCGYSRMLVYDEDSLKTDFEGGEKITIKPIGQEGG